MVLLPFYFFFLFFRWTQLGPSKQVKREEEEAYEPETSQASLYPV